MPVRCGADDYSRTRPPRRAAGRYPAIRAIIDLHRRSGGRRDSRISAQDGIDRVRHGVCVDPRARRGSAGGAGPGNRAPRSRRVGGTARELRPDACGIRHATFALARRRSEARRWRRTPLDQGDARPVRRRIRRAAQGRVRRVRTGADATRADAVDAGQRCGDAGRRRPRRESAHARRVGSLRFHVRQRDECAVRRSGRKRRRVGHCGGDGARLHDGEEPLPCDDRLHGRRGRGAGTARRDALGAVGTRAQRACGGDDHERYRRQLARRERPARRRHAAALRRRRPRPERNSPRNGSGASKQAARTIRRRASSPGRYGMPRSATFPT